MPALLCFKTGLLKYDKCLEKLHMKNNYHNLAEHTELSL